MNRDVWLFFLMGTHNGKGEHIKQLLEHLRSMDRNFIFSGQILVREQGPSVALDLSTRNVFSLVGLIAVPKHTILKGEHQYSLAGFDHPSEGIILGLDSHGKDMTEAAKGNSLGNLLLQPIWRI